MAGSDFEYPRHPIGPKSSLAARMVPVVTFVLFFIGMSSSGNSEDAWGNRRGFELIWCLSIAWIAARITYWLQRLCSPDGAGLMEYYAIGIWVGLAAEATILTQWASHKPVLTAVIEWLGGLMFLDLLWIANCKWLRTTRAAKKRIRPNHKLFAPGIAMGVFGVALVVLLSFSLRGEEMSGEWRICAHRRAEIDTLQYWYYQKHHKLVLGGKAAIELLFRDAGETIDDIPRCAQGGTYSIVKLADGIVAIECSCPDHADVEGFEIGEGIYARTITIR